MPNGKLYLLLSGMLAGILLLLLLVAAQAEGDERVPDAANGERLFNEYCAACHNQLGKVGPYLAEDVAYFVNAGIPGPAMGSLLRHPVRERPPGSRMPAFTPEEISDADLDDMGLYLASKTPPPKTPPALGVAEHGAPLYAQHCAGCHGDKGEGVAHFLPVAVFANQLKQGGAPPNVMLGFVMLATRSGNAPKMPTFSPKVLSDKELADIAAHIWSMPMPVMPEKPAAEEDNN